MNVVFTKKLPFIIIFLLLFFLFGSYTIYKNETMQIKKDIHSELTTNSLNIKSYFTTAQALIYSLKYTLEDKFQLKNTKHSAFHKYKYDEKTNLFKLVNFDGLNSMDLSSLTGIGNPSNFSSKKKDEIHSALHLKPIFNATMEAIPELKWVYYTSKEEFIYISPNYNYETSKDLVSQYKLAFWKEAIPKNNPSKNMVITDLYEDGIHKGLITTLSQPIFKKKSFKGVVSIDIGLSNMANLLPKMDLRGETFLIDEKEQIVASKKEFKLKDSIDCKLSNVIKLDVIEGELYLAHVIEEFDLRKEALFRSSGKIIILFLLLFITFVALYLKTILTKVEYYANTDPLTDLLNRRSMYKAMNKLIDINSRYEQNLSVLLLDLDFFKKINDDYGHQIGDKVLVEVSRLFKNNTRSCDIVARLGGEEFLIALVNTDLNAAYILAERIREATQKIEIDTYNINFTISIGCTEVKKDDNFSTLLRRADKLLYKAKESGRNQTVKDEEN